MMAADVGDGCSTLPLSRSLYHLVSCVVNFRLPTSLLTLRSFDESLNSVGGGASVFITISFTKLIHLSIQTCLKLEPLEFFLSTVLFADDGSCHRRQPTVPTC